MVSSRARTVDEYLATLPEGRAEAIGAVRAVVLRNLPKGYEETVNWGMLCYEIPIERYPDTYNKQPLSCVALAAQKNYCAIYLFGPYSDPKLRKMLEDAFAKSGRKMDMGKSCLRFKSADDLPLDAVGKIIASVPPEALIAQYQASRPPKKK
jgi:hypothetical protein